MVPGEASHIPTSAIIENLLGKAPADFVTLDWLIGELRERSFGIVLLVMALLALIPGGSTFIGFLLAYPAIQMMLARPGPTLPRAIAERRVATARVAGVFKRATPVLRWLERFVRPRWRAPFEATKRLVGVVVLSLAPTLIWPFPFGHVIPSLVVGLLSLAYLEEDGVLLCVALAAAVFSLAITAATVWAGIRVVDLL